MDALGSLLPFLLILVVGYVLIIRPQQKRAREIRATQAAVSVGSRVLMGSGMYATVVELGEDRVTVEPSPGVRMEFARAAVYQVLDAFSSLDDRPADDRPVDERPISDQP